MLKNTKDNIIMICGCCTISFLIMTFIIYFWGTLDGKPINFYDSTYYTGLATLGILALFGWGWVCTIFAKPQAKAIIKRFKEE